MKQRRILNAIIGLALFFALWVGWSNPAGADVKAQSEGDAWKVELRPVLSTSSEVRTYQGYLEHNGSPAEGSFDLQFQLYPTAGNGAPFGDPILYEDLEVISGAFSVAPDWGNPALNHGHFWIEVSLRAGSSNASDPFTVLTQRLRQDSGERLRAEPAASAPAANPQQAAPSQQQIAPVQPVEPQGPLAPGDFSPKASSPVPLTSVTSDPNTGWVYAQADGGYDFYIYEPVTDIWSSLPASPLNSGNNGGAVYLNGKIYTVYSGDGVNMGIYDIANYSWTTVANPLGAGTGVIASDGIYVYLAVGSSFKAYDPTYNWSWDLPAPSINIQQWGGMSFWNGNLYAHEGNGSTAFARYDIALGSWTTLPSLPGGAVLGSTIDPVAAVYYAYGGYYESNLYLFDLIGETWSSVTIPYFSVNDGGLAYIPQANVSGVYFIQGEGATGFARVETVPYFFGNFSFQSYSPVRLTSVAADPTTGLIYAQQDQGTAFYAINPRSGFWSWLPDSPLFSGNNGGAAYLNGKIYTSYTENWTDIGVYDIASYTWSTIPNPLSPLFTGTGVIASDGTYLYLAVGGTFKRYDPVGGFWSDLAAPSIDIQPWGGMAFWNGKLYAHRGNGNIEFARYDIASNTWATLPSLPGGAVLGSAIDPVRHEYYAYGNYSGSNWYIFDLDTESWSTQTIPFLPRFLVDDGGMAYSASGPIDGVYFVQGENGSSFGLYQDGTAPTGGFSINNNAAYVNTTAVTLNVTAADPETGVTKMRFRNNKPWKALVFQDVYPWGLDSVQKVLVDSSLPYDQLTSADMASVDLSPYTQIIIPSVQDGTGFYGAFNANLSKFEDFIDGGGSMFMSVATYGESVSLPFGGSNPFYTSNDNYIVEPGHPIFAGVANPYYGSAASHNTLSGLLPDDTVLVTTGSAPGGDPVMIERHHGSGLLVAGGQTFEFGWNFGWEGGKILENGILYVAGQVDWSVSQPWTLSSGDGVKTVYGQFRNGGGRWNVASGDTITLDTHAPTAAATCVAKTYKSSFAVNWSGSDGLSGIANYDVQYRVGTGGTWTNWPGLIGTTKTTATFGPNSPIDVEHLKTYYFRTRAHDKAGNVGTYAPAGDCSTYVDLAYIRLPLVLVTYAAPCGADNNYCEDYDSWEKAYGPLSIGQNYQAYPNDTVDYYYFNLNKTSNVTIVVTNYQASGQLLLYRHREGTTPELVANYGGGGTTMTIGPLSLTANTYYIQVYSETFNPGVKYTLKVTAN